MREFGDHLKTTVMDRKRRGKIDTKQKNPLLSFQIVASLTLRKPTSLSKYFRMSVGSPENYLSMYLQRLQTWLYKNAKELLHNSYEPIKVVKQL